MMNFTALDAAFAVTESWQLLISNNYTISMQNNGIS